MRGSTTEKGRPELDQVVRRVQDISTLPHVAIQVMEVANNPRAGAVDLKDAMESDAALCARVLRCANSSAYAVRGQVANLQHAIAYLGLKQVRNLAITAAISDLFRSNRSIGPYNRSGLWKHLVSVGICARLIALRLSFEDFEDIFLAGLLHDIGIIFEDHYVHGQFCEVMHSIDEGRTLARTEREHLGFDHTTLGERVACKWRFPEGIRAAIRHHHASADYRGEHINAVRCVEVANLLCTAQGVPSVGVKLVTFSQPAIDGLSLSRDDILVISKNLSQELADNSNLFNI